MSEAVMGLYRERLSAGSARESFAGAAVPAARLQAARAGTVRFEAVGKVYRGGAGDVPALSGIDVEIPAGGIFGIIGRSGAGKSSLIRLVNRLELPTSGRVLVDGQDIARLDEDGLVSLRRRVGMVFQHFNLLSAKTVRENVALPLLVAGAGKAEIARRVEEVLGLVGLDGKHDAYPSRLSGGQKQRVGIARALAGGPQILLCDEATSALDPETTLSILTLLKDINRRLGLTILLITHEMSVIREICDRVLVLDRGEVAETGPVWRVFGDPRHDATRALLRPLTRGLPEDLSGRLRSHPAPDGGEVVVELFFSGGREPDPAALATASGGPVRILTAVLDRIDGHTQGRILVAARPAPGSAPPDFSRVCERAEVLGYV